MMKRFASMALALTTALSLCTAVSAADEGTDKVSGFYGIDEVQNVAITPASDTVNVTNTSVDVDGDGTNEDVFANSDKLTVTYSAASEGTYYGIILVEGSDLPTYDDDIYYINQVTAESGTVSFDVYPILPSDTTDMTLYISSSDEDEPLIEINLAYAADTQISGGDDDGVITDFDTKNFDDSTKGAAAITRPEGGWVVGENTFSVSAQVVCRAYVTNDGINYTILESTLNADGSHSYTVNIKPDTGILVVVVGDASNDGKLSNADATRLKAHLGSKITLEGSALLGADASGEGSLSNADATRIKASLGGKRALDW